MADALLSRPNVAAGRFLRRAIVWWLDELADLAPASLRRRLGRSTQDRAILDFVGDRVFLLLRQAGRPVPLTFQVGNTPEDDRHRLGALLHRHRAGTGVTLRLDAAQLFVTTLDLPRAAEASLDAVLRHQVERLVPLAAEEIVLGRRVLPRSSQATSIKVVIVVTRRTALMQALSTAAGLGLSARQVVAEVDEAGFVPITLWHADSSRGETASRRRLRHGLEIAAFAGLLGAYGLHVYRLSEVRDQLQAAVVQAKDQAVTARDLGQRVAQSADAVEFLHGRRQQPTALFVLDRLTTLLPLDTWVSDLNMRGRSVEIIGAAPRATNLIALIEGSSVFGQPQFRSPITLQPDGEAERFDLTFTVMPDKPH